MPLTIEPFQKPQCRPCKLPLASSSGWQARCPKPRWFVCVQRWPCELKKSTPKTVGDPWQILPSNLASVRESIEKSRAIVGLIVEQDEQGGIAYSEEVWRRAADFVAKNALWMWNHFDCAIDSPNILPGPSGSIDIHWDRPSYEMLINIPADPDAMATFYGDDRGQITIKGRFDSTKFNYGLHIWLAKMA